MFIVQIKDVKFKYQTLSCDPYNPASLFFAKPSMKVPYEGHVHLRGQGPEKADGPTTEVYGLTC